jgi:hypothetical protein
MEPVPHVVVAVAGASAAATESVSDAPTGKASLPTASIAFGAPLTESAGAPIGATGTLVPLPSSLQCTTTTRQSSQSRNGKSLDFALAALLQSVAAHGPRDGNRRLMVESNL